MVEKSRNVTISVEKSKRIETSWQLKVTISVESTQSTKWQRISAYIHGAVRVTENKKVL